MVEIRHLSREDSEGRKRRWDGGEEGRAKGEQLRSYTQEPVRHSDRRVLHSEEISILVTYQASQASRHGVDFAYPGRLQMPC